MIIIDQNVEAIEEGKAEKGLVNEWIYKTINSIEKRDSKISDKIKDKTGNIRELSF